MEIVYFLPPFSGPVDLGGKLFSSGTISYYGFGQNLAQGWENYGLGTASGP